MAINIQYRNPFGGAAAFLAGRGRARSQAKAQEAQMQFQADQVFGQQIATGITNFVQPVAQAAIFKGLGGQEGLTSDEMNLQASDFIMNQGSIPLRFGGGGRRGGFGGGGGGGGGGMPQFSPDQMLQMGEQFLQANPDHMPGFGNLTGTDRKDAVIRAGRFAVQQQGVQQDQDQQVQMARRMGEVKSQLKLNADNASRLLNENYRYELNDQSKKKIAEFDQQAQAVMANPDLTDNEKADALTQIHNKRNQIKPTWNNVGKPPPTVKAEVESGQAGFPDRANGGVWLRQPDGKWDFKKHTFPGEGPMAGEAWGKDHIYHDPKTGASFYNDGDKWRHFQGSKGKNDNLQAWNKLISDTQKAMMDLLPKDELGFPKGSVSIEEASERAYTIVEKATINQRRLDGQAKLAADQEARDEAKHISNLQAQRAFHDQQRQKQQLIDAASNPQVVEKAKDAMVQILKAVGGNPDNMPDNLKGEWQQAAQIVQMSEQLQARRSDDRAFQEQQQQAGGNGNQTSDQEKAQIALTEIKRRYPDPRKAPDEVKQQIPKLTQLAQGGGQGATAPATTQPAG